jgi:hypothetical protein
MKMDNTRPMSLAMALKDFFGFLPEQTINSFMLELKALDDADRAYFRKALQERGYNIAP